jgi:2-C-methyl-D-erythritol 4-phosphate cytidylyltransferase
MPVSAIIVAAGSSTRMGFDKLAVPLAGIPVLQRTLAAFLAATMIDEIIVVCPPERWRLLGQVPTTTATPGGPEPCIVADGGGQNARATGGTGILPAAKPIRRVDGGASRQDSVANGLAALSPGTTLVAVHDGARPLIHPADIDRCVHAAATHAAIALARRVTETLKRADPADFCVASVSREHLWLMETPQVFGTALLQTAYAELAARQLTVTDEVSALQAIGARVKFIESTHPNPKITCPADLALAAAILTNR